MGKMGKEEEMKTLKYKEYYEALSKAREERIHNLKDKHSHPRRYFYAQWQVMKNKYYKAILEKIAQEKYFTILDIGCGRGEDLSYFSKRRTFISYGVDLSFNQLKIARDRDFKKSRFTAMQANAQQLPFKSSIFDFIICSELIEHLPKPQLCIKEAYRVLKNKGYLVMTTPNKYSYFTLISKIFPLFLRKRLGKVIRGTPKDIDSSLYAPHKNIKEHIREFSPFELKKMLNLEGFKVGKIEGGILAVPLSFLFDRIILLQRLWLLIDKIIGLLPLSFYFKSNFLIVAKKINE